MAAFNPIPLLLPQVMNQAGLALGQALAPPPPPAYDPGLTAAQLAVQKAEAREAQTAADLAAREQALRARQDHDDATASADATARKAEINNKLTRDVETRGALLRQDTGTARADQAARGIAVGGTARTLLRGLADDADADTRDARQAAADRLDTIRRDLEARRQRNLLSLTEEQQRAELARHGAATSTAFARRDAWVREVDAIQRNHALEAQRQQARAAEAQRRMGGIFDDILRRR